MTALRAYLVDLDGTLADTAAANYEAYGAALREVGVGISREAFERDAFGRNWRQFLPGMLREAGSMADPAGVAARKVELYRDAVHRIRFNEALLMLLASRSDTTRAALVTTASAQNVKSVLAARPEVQQLFDAIVTGDDVPVHKPDPGAFIVAARLLEVAPAHCLVFEDSEAGVAAGLAFGASVLRIRM